MTNDIPREIFDIALEHVMNQEIRKLNRENQRLKEEIREMDKMNEESKNA